MEGTATTVELNPQPPDRTLVYLAKDGQLVGRVELSQQVRAGTPAIIAQLKAAGVSQTVLLTGDEEAVAQPLATRWAQREAHRLSWITGNRNGKVTGKQLLMQEIRQSRSVLLCSVIVRHVGRNIRLEDDDLVGNALLFLFVRSADYPVEDRSVVAIPRDPLPADIQRDGFHNLEDRPGFR